MIWLIYLFLILPILIGITIRSKAAVYLDTLGAEYTFGFLFLFVVFGVLYFPCMVTETLLHVLTILFLIVCIALTGISLFLLIHGKRWREWKNPLRILKEQDKEVIILWIIAIILISFQLFRVIVLQPFEFRDDKVYNALVNDMVFHDSIYRTAAPSGTEIPISEVLMKYRLSAWMPYEAFFSQITGMHPLIICRTIFPALVLFCHYCMIDYLGKWLFHREAKGRALFLLTVALLNHACSMNLDQALIVTQWPAWGKSVVSSIVMPSILVLMMKCESEQKKKKGIFILCIFLLAGCFSSAMGYLIPPIEILILFIVSFIRRKRRKRHGDATFGI